MRIPEEKIDEIRDAANILDVVSGYVALKKSGKNFLGLCPFHTEKTPSFTVNMERRMYKCFGCGAGGNVISFVMEMEKIPFLEAVELLARRAGITLQKSRTEGEFRRDDLYRLNEKVATWFHTNLTEAAIGEQARAYCAQRGISDAMIVQYQLGFAPDAWDGVLNFFRHEPRTVTLLQQLGLVVPREKAGGHYDRFRNRLIFPISNEMGRVCGFGGRELGEESGAKYLNSPETPVYQKGHILYGLTQAKESIRQQNLVVVVEGNLDLIAVAQAGVCNVVAPLGTALTSRQARVLRRFADEALLVFDADTAGIAATQRGAGLMLQEGLEVSVIALDTGYDPDSYIQEHGAAAFQQLINERRGLLDFYAGLHARLGRENRVQQQASLIKQLLEMIGLIDDGIRRDVLANAVAEKFSLDLANVRRSLRPQRKRESARASNATTAGTHAQSATGPIAAADRDMLQFLLTYSDVATPILEHFRQFPAEDPLVQKVLEALQRLRERGQTPDLPALLDATEEPAERRMLMDIEATGAHAKTMTTDPEKLVVIRCRGRQRVLLERDIKMINHQLLDKTQRYEDLTEKMQKLKELKSALSAVDPHVSQAAPSKI